MANVRHREGWCILRISCFFVEAEDGIRDLVRSRGLGDVYKRQALLVHRHLIDQELAVGIVADEDEYAVGRHLVDLVRLHVAQEDFPHDAIALNLIDHRIPDEINLLVGEGELLELSLIHI